MTRRALSTYGVLAGRFDALFDDVERLTELEGLTMDGILRPFGVRSVLDCAAGTGIQAIALAARGYEVAASDISPRMLAALSVKAAAAGAVISTRRQDFRHLTSWPGHPFDAVICCGGSITLVPTDEDVASAVRGMVRLARNGRGPVVIGLHNYSFERDRDRQFVLRRPFMKERGELAFDTREFGRESVTVTHTLMALREGRWRLTTSSNVHRYLDPQRLCRILLAAGCGTVQLRNLAGREASVDDEWVLAVGSAVD